jgi:hypothetical protein
VEFGGVCCSGRIPLICCSFLRCFSKNLFCCLSSLAVSRRLLLLAAAPKPDKSDGPEASSVLGHDTEAVAEASGNDLPADGTGLVARNGVRNGLGLVLGAVGRGISPGILDPTPGGVGTCLTDPSGAGLRNGVALSCRAGEVCRIGAEFSRGTAVGVGEVIDTAAPGVAIAVAEGDVAAVLVSPRAAVGLTNVFGGGFGGGVASDLIFIRSFSAA